MSVYFAESNGYVKIGYSASVMQRMASLPSDYSKRPKDLPRHSTVTLIGWFPGTKRDELLAHAAMNDHWADGEWYRDCEAVRSYLASQPEALVVADVSAQAMFAVLNGASVHDATQDHPLVIEAKVVTS